MKIADPKKTFDRREDPRFSYSGNVFFATENGVYEAELKNFSQYGIFIQTYEQVCIGEIITVALPYSEKDNDKRKGRIVRCSREGFGVRLLNKLNGTANKLKQKFFFQFNDHQHSVVSSNGLPHTPSSADGR